jgi:hypothetical protein
MYSMSNMNKFQNSYQVWEKIQYFVFWKKFKDLQWMFKQIYLAQNSYPNTIDTNVHKMYKFDKNQVPYCNVKKKFKWKF